MHIPHRHSTNMTFDDMSRNNEASSPTSMDAEESEIDFSSAAKKKPIDLDDVLVNEIGQFGRYQLRNLLLVALPIFTSAWFNDFVFTGAALPHRCRITECGETSKNDLFESEWILNAVPQTGSGVAGCQRYVPVGNNGSLDYCPASLFNQSRTQSCDGLVYGRNNSVVYDFDLGCREWLRAVSGTVMNSGALLALPVAGYISDRFGRRFVLIYSLFNTSLIGVIRAFSVNYPMFLTLQFFWAFLGTGTYSAAYIFGAELTGPKYRVIASATCSSMFALGQALMGALAWLVQPWRYLMLTLAVPAFFLVSYYWILDESARWLLSKKKYDRARFVLQKVAKTNKKKISEKSISGLIRATPSETVENLTDGTKGLFRKTLQSPILLRRVCTTPVWWAATTFVYYGLSINAVSLSDTGYLNYILVCIIEIPGYFLAVVLLARIGRKPTLFFGYTMSAACNFAFPFVINESIRLTLYLVAKFSISVVFTSVYLFTAELYPTEFRHSFVSFSSMIGRIGAIVAPLTPALMVYWKGIPSMLFGSLGVLSALLVLTQPETLGTKLPDTLAEAEALGRPDYKLRM